jgi:hypothetical protein
VILAIAISPDSRPNFGNAPDQTQSNPINWDQANQLEFDPIGSPILAMLPILVMTS